MEKLAMVVGLLYAIMIAACLIGMPIACFRLWKNNSSRSRLLARAGMIMWTGIILLMSSIIYCNTTKAPKNWVELILITAGFAVMLIGSIFAGQKTGAHKNIKRVSD